MPIHNPGGNSGGGGGGITEAEMNQAISDAVAQATTDLTNTINALTKADVGLSNVPNYPATSLYNAAATDKLATQKAVHDLKQEVDAINVGGGGISEGDIVETIESGLDVTLSARNAQTTRVIMNTAQSRTFNIDSSVFNRYDTIEVVRNKAESGDVLTIDNIQSGSAKVHVHFKGGNNENTHTANGRCIVVLRKMSTDLSEITVVEVRKF